MFFFILFFLGILIFFLLFSTIKIEIRNFKLSTEKYKGRTLNKDYKLIISLIRIIQLNLININIDRSRLEKLKLNINKINFQSFNIDNAIDVKTFKDVKKYAPKIKKIKLLIDIGTEDAIVTSYAVVVISSLLGILLRKPLENCINNNFTINPLYINKNILNLELNCIFETKLIHIIHIIYILNKKRRDDKNGRTSNRRTYGYSYEQHPRYDRC